MSRLIFASHGKLSVGMLDSVKMIVGDLANDVESISLNPGQSPNDFYLKLKAEAEKSDEKIIILCDVLGGSVHTTLSQLRQFDHIMILSGMNMGLALDLVMKYKNDLSLDQVQKLVDHSKEGICVIQGESSEENDEDF
ncbi:MAG: hypothetical protein Q4C49_10575 [Bacillota bacterium]|nr:hypothetical protein [Bacillota bacterium]